MAKRDSGSGSGTLEGDENHLTNINFARANTPEDGLSSIINERGGGGIIIPLPGH